MSTFKDVFSSKIQSFKERFVRIENDLKKLLSKDIVEKSVGKIDLARIDVKLASIDKTINLHREQIEKFQKFMDMLME